MIANNLGNGIASITMFDATLSYHDGNGWVQTDWRWTKKVNILLKPLESTKVEFPLSPYAVHGLENTNTIKLLCVVQESSGKITSKEVGYGLSRPLK